MRVTRLLHGRSIQKWNGPIRSHHGTTVLNLWSNQYHVPRLGANENRSRFTSAITVRVLMSPFGVQYLRLAFQLVLRYHDYVILSHVLMRSAISFDPGKLIARTHRSAA